MNPLAHKSAARPAIDSPEGDYVPPQPVIRENAGKVVKQEPPVPMSADRFKEEIPVFGSRSDVSEYGNSEDGARMEITLPWPPRELSPNARIHWAKRAKAVKSYRSRCWGETKEAGHSITWAGYIVLWVTFVPPDRRHRDDDNMIAAFKAGRDGIAQALGVDDKRFRVVPYVTDQPVKGGKVVVRLTPGPEESKYLGAA